jgi:hypothetical protein
VRALVCAAACLPAGFGVAELTGVRPLGGIVLVALAALACVWADAPAWRVALWAGLLAVLFVASHLLGDAIGTWPAIAVVTLLATLSHFAL